MFANELEMLKDVDAIVVVAIVTMTSRISRESKMSSKR